MKKISKKLIKVLAGLLLFFSVGLLLISLLMRMTNTHYNATPSLPLGFYQQIDKPIGLGAYVAFCPDKRDVFDMALARNYISAGDCPNGYRPLLKRVFAMTGDTVSIQEDGVFINTRHVPNSAQMKTDALVAELPAYQLKQHALSDQEFLLLSDINPKSFDARYFGLAKRSEITAVVRPIFTWESWDF